MSRFAENIKILRKKKGLSQADMDQFGFTQSRWSSYEAGVARPNLDDFIRIAEIFEISETDLLHTDLSRDGEYKKTTKPPDTTDMLIKLVEYQKAEIELLKKQMTKKK